jgi:hypothetical protein
MVWPRLEASIASRELLLLEREWWTGIGIPGVDDLAAGARG